MIRMWDSASGEMMGCFYDLHDHGARVNTLIFSVCVETLYGGDGNGRVTVWSVSIIDDGHTPVSTLPLHAIH